MLEIAGMALVGIPVALDLRRGTSHQSRPLVGDLRAVDLVAAEEAFLGSQVRALLVALAVKDGSTEEHTRRVALLAVEVGDELGLPSGRLRAVAMGGLLHDIGKLSVRDQVLRKPAALTDEEFAEVKLHPAAGVALLEELGGFDPLVLSLVMDHHERLDGSGYPTLPPSDVRSATRPRARRSCRRGSAGRGRGRSDRPQYARSSRWA